MLEAKRLRESERDGSVRTLKIEADGDRWKGLVKPKIRLVGRWLERAGFKPGQTVRITLAAPGVIELRSSGAVSMHDLKRTASELPKGPP